MFENHMARWNLVRDGDPIATRSSRLLPVQWRGKPAMLKVALAEEEKSGAALMRWWQGVGAAQVYAQHGDGLLLERATGDGSLAGMTLDGRDEEASCILCATIAQLHAPHDKPLPELVALERWFRGLEPAAVVQGGLLKRCADTARILLADPHDIVVLHGDIHHGNVLDFGARGWLAIDPKGLHGERGFDYANLFCNPGQAIAVENFIRRVDVVAQAAGLQRKRLLQWIVAWCGLSAAWSLDDGESPQAALEMASLAIAELDR